MITAVIIDDERLAIKELELHLKTYEKIAVEATFTDPFEGLSYIEKQKPNLVFLDINIPGIKGIEIAEKLLDIDSKIQVIFVTAYDEYAIEAFGVHALDYIMKPIDKKRLDKTIERISIPEEKNVDIEMDELQINCLGGFQICWTNHEPIKWRTAKTKELMAYLIHKRESRITKEIILDKLWPDQQIEKAMKQLYNGIYYIRKALLDYGITKEMITIDGDYGLQLKNVKIDMEVFNKLVHQTSVSEEDINCIYKGDYMANENWDWALSRSGNIREVYVETMLTVAEVYMKQSQFDNAISLLRRLYEFEPFEEKISFQLIKVFIQKKEINKAFDHYEKYEEMLELEMGIKPEENLQNLLKNI